MLSVKNLVGISLHCKLHKTIKQGAILASQYYLNWLIIYIVLSF
jgi:hypothetical protein